MVLQEEKAEWLIYVTDEGQAGHFKLVFGAGKKAGIIPAEHPPRIDHVGFGLVLGQDGKRIRTRDSGAVRHPSLLSLPPKKALLSAGRDWQPMSSVAQSGQSKSSPAYRQLYLETDGSITH